MKCRVLSWFLLVVLSLINHGCWKDCGGLFTPPMTIFIYDKDSISIFSPQNDKYSESILITSIINGEAYSMDWDVGTPDNGVGPVLKIYDTTSDLKFIDKDVQLIIKYAEYPWDTLFFKNTLQEKCDDGFYLVDNEYFTFQGKSYESESKQDLVFKVTKDFDYYE